MNFPVKTLAAGSVLAAGITSALACGFEDPSSADTQRGLLNWAFPNALYVKTAVWKAQAEGLLERPRSDASQALVGYQRALKQLQALGDRLAVAANKHSEPSLSFVLIGPMLWARLETRDGVIALKAHVQSSAPGDVVVVTDETVVAAMAGGKITPANALNRGLVRLYGSADAVAQVEVWLTDASLRATPASEGGH